MLLLASVPKIRLLKFEISHFKHRIFRFIFIDKEKKKKNNLNRKGWRLRQEIRTDAEQDKEDDKKQKISRRRIFKLVVKRAKKWVP